jgi:hypothetical protein
VPGAFLEVGKIAIGQVNRRALHVTPRKRDEMRAYRVADAAAP